MDPTEGHVTKRRAGVEIRAVVWLARHPLMTLMPAALVWLVATVGPWTPAIIAGAVGAAGLVWYRGHPMSFDAIAAPLLRSGVRRWGVYVGPRWWRAMEACELSKTHRRTGVERVPRIIRVRSYSPTIDSILVRMLPGQKIATFEARLVELADTLRVQRVAVERVKPGVAGLVIERKEAFTEPIPAPDLPEDPGAVDLGSVYVGETEHGQDWRLPVAGKHLFVAGATGAGKNSIPMSLLVGLAPLIRDGLVRIWCCDPKQLEFSQLSDICHRYAATESTCAELIGDYVADMHATQRKFAFLRRRKLHVSRDTPLNILLLDEMGALLAYGDPLVAREVRRLLALVGSQGRATGHSMWGLVQEPTKDTVSIRDLFTLRICLRLTAAAHVDGVLGENSRLRGALADEIPDLPDTAGIGYVIRQRSRVPVRVRAAYVEDADIAKLVAFVLAGRDQLPAAAGPDSQPAPEAAEHTGLTDRLRGALTMTGAT
ncbi:FtsK/SpoIIIE domain-containing protein [Amycolatopsis sp. H20-H5]|uniref:FtsK/SpoIIIE domain-containing protein n=1 Tax=Amycolatopsis sp. H20-H5 TaxID=3046309 RepID=UPI002DB72A24|nr:FtsK/SpoIIIE domain-containing protein [Amycolatopsis sp. H20-H5]MEC3974856.1 FtsK/SpoIIIE domain-containing protein [Amycolatopsis sp. H20-H5]